MRPTDSLKTSFFYSLPVSLTGCGLVLLPPAAHLLREFFHKVHPFFFSWTSELGGHMGAFDRPGAGPARRIQPCISGGFTAERASSGNHAETHDARAVIFMCTHATPPDRSGFPANPGRNHAVDSYIPGVIGDGGGCMGTFEVGDPGDSPTGPKALGSSVPD
jgi:hypothetical protein